MLGGVGKCKRWKIVEGVRKKKRDAIFFIKEFFVYIEILIQVKFYLIFFFKFETRGFTKRIQ